MSNTGSNNTFRPLRPSHRDASASSSTPATLTPITSESTTGSDPHRGQGNQTEGSATASTPSKRRRVPDTVTRNACLPCKKARSKCDGARPCNRCEARDRGECVYEVHTKHKKEELVEQLRMYKASGHLKDEILDAIISGEQIAEIRERLARQEPHQSIVEWLGRYPVPQQEILSPRVSHHSYYESSDHDHELGGLSPEPFRWTSVTNDKAILDHLFQLYFAWVHPVHTLFDERLFVRSYNNLKADNFCSPVLANAICAMACHLNSSDGDDFEHLGDDFSEAARAALDYHDNQITMIQSFAVMFLVDCARANVLRAEVYLNVATEGLVKAARVGTRGFDQLWGKTLRGIRNLNVEWAQITFKASSPTIFARFKNLETLADDYDDTREWYCYRNFGDTTPGWPALLATTDREKYKLLSIIDEVTKVMYATKGEDLTAQDVLKLYGRLVQWRSELPRSIGSIESNGGQALPHVLSLLILYALAVVQLLRPLLDFEGFPSLLVEETIWRAAHDGLYLLNEHYRTQFTCRHQPVLQMFSLLHFADVVCRFFPDSADGIVMDGAGVIQFGLQALMQSYAGFPEAGPLQEMLRKIADECSLSLPVNRILPKKRYGMDDLIDACSRPSFVQPAAEIHRRYATSFAVDWAKSCASMGFRAPSHGKKLRGSSVEDRAVAHDLTQISNPNVLSISNLLNNQ